MFWALAGMLFGYALRHEPTSGEDKPILGKRGEPSWSLRPEGAASFKAPRTSVSASPQEQRWNGVLAQGAQHDFHHLTEYHRLAKERGEGSAHRLEYWDGAYTIALPPPLRPIEAFGREAWSAATSVHGHAGPLPSHAYACGRRADFRRS